MFGLVSESSNMTAELVFNGEAGPSGVLVRTRIDTRDEFEPLSIAFGLGVQGQDR